MDPVLEAEIKKFPPETQAIIRAISAANRVDEQKIVDDLLADVGARRTRLFDIIYVDLSIDRSTSPIEVTGGGTILASIEATDNNANLEIAFEFADGDTNRRFQMRRGKRLFLPYTRFFIYHSAQSGKTIKLLRARELPSVRLGVEDDSGETANSDLVNALGNSSGFTPSQVTVTGSSTSIVAANTSRKRVTLVNTDPAATVYINDGVATTSHFPLLPGTYLVLNTTAEIRGITSGGSVVIGVMEE